jgi:hypothetical protein
MPSALRPWGEEEREKESRAATVHTRAMGAEHYVEASSDELRRAREVPARGSNPLAADGPRLGARLRVSGERSAGPTPRSLTIGVAGSRHSGGGGPAYGARAPWSG